VGIGLGVGLLVGARAETTGSAHLLVLVIVGLMLLAVVSRSGQRAVFFCLLGGSIVGWSVAAMRTGETVDTQVIPPASWFEGTVASDPRVSPSGTRAQVHWTDAKGSGQRVLAFFPVTSVAAKGDRVSVRGRVSVESSDPMIFVTTVEVLQRANRIELRRRAIREYCADAMIRYVPGSAGSLALGLLIGDDTGLSSAERRDLRASGLSHITAVSGWNVSVVVASAGALFRAAGARGWRWLSVQLALLSGYVWIVGLEPPIQRAAIMGAVALIALQLGRPAHMITLLTLTAGLMVVWDPKILGSLSFLLSFLSMVGLAVAARICADLDGWRAMLISPAVAASSAGIVTAPLLAASFGTIALMTVPANLAAGPLIPYATFAGILVVMTSWFPPVAAVLGWLDWIISNVVLFISSSFAGVSWGHHMVAPLDPSTALTIYFAIALCALPFFPEGRTLVRRLEAWIIASPGSAVFSVLIGSGVIVIGFLAV
jgi:competence protein ComEC